MIRKSITIFSSTALEYFEFSIFLFYSYVISKYYFNNNSYSIPILFVLITFMGKFFGGTFIASFIDKIGSIKIYKFTMALTAICTIILLILPNYEQIGVLAGIFFILIRFIQVAAASAEAGASIILSRENFKNRAFASSLTAAAFIFGCGIANLISNIVNIEYFKYVIVSSSILLFSFRYYLIKGGLKDRFESNDTEIKKFQMYHIIDVLKVIIIMIPTSMIQFHLFNFKSKNNSFNMLLMSIFCLVAIVYSLLNKRYLNKIILGYFLLFFISIVSIFISIEPDIYKILIIVPYGAFMSSLFAVILDNIDSKKSGMILTMGAAIANTVAVYLLQNAGEYYIHYICLFSVIGFLTSLKIGSFNAEIFKKKGLNT